MAREFTTEDLRAAVLHLVQLAACYEARKPGVVDAAAESKLADVVVAMEQHRGSVQKASLQGLTVELVNQLADVYPDYQSAAAPSADALKRQLREVFDGFRLGLPDEDLETLVPAPDEITIERGPVEFAAKVVSEVIGPTSRSFYNWQSKQVPALAPTAFSLRFGERGLLRYVLGLFDFPGEEANRIVDGWTHSRPR